MSGFNKVTEWIMRFAVINIIWLLFNLPIVLLLVAMFITGHLDYQAYYLLPLVILAPILFFPSTAAMFACAREWVIDKNYDNKLIRSFLRFYRENYRKSLIGGLLLTVVWATWYFDFNYFKDQNTTLMFTFIILGIILLAYTINFFSVIVHFDITLIKVFKNTFAVTLGSPVLLIAVLIVSAILFYISVNGPLFLLLFFIFSLHAYVCFSAFYRLYLNLTNRTVQSNE